MAFANELQPTSDAFELTLRRAMAEYEAARIRYREVVLASLDGRADGAAIRAAVDGARAAYAALERCRSRGPSRASSAPRRSAPRWIPRVARRWMSS